jgi:hypothetical protein
MTPHHTTNNLSHKTSTISSTILDNKVKARMSKKYYNAGISKGLDSNRLKAGRVLMKSNENNNLQHAIRAPT